MWPEEAWRLRQTGRPLTELAGVGPWIASKLEEWMVDPPEVPEPPPLRSGFRSYAECRDIVGADPVWRKAVRADLQMHTSETDGALPLGEMVDAAGEFGHEFIAITDHLKGLAITNGMDEVRLARQGEEIAALNRRGQRPRVLRSIEMNISPLGVEDMAGRRCASSISCWGLFTRSCVRRTCNARAAASRSVPMRTTPTSCTISRSASRPRSRRIPRAASSSA